MDTRMGESMKPPACRNCGGDCKPGACKANGPKAHAALAAVAKAPVTLTPIGRGSSVVERPFRKGEVAGSSPAHGSMSLNESLKSKRGRPQLSDHKLTPAERKQRQRAKQEGV